MASDGAIKPDGRLWVSLHLYYHGDRDRAILGAVQPAVAELARERLIDACHFLRYSLGGPHVRLRLLPKTGRRGEVASIAERALADFLERFPAAETVEDEEIRRVDQTVAAGDSNESAPEALPPNNSFARHPFEPEVDRYGGPALLPASLRMFTLSSCAALCWLGEAEEMTRGRRLTHGARLLMLQAAGCARGVDELAGLVGYGARWWQRLEPLVAKADTVFEKAPERYVALVRTALDPEAAVGLGDEGAVEDPGALLFGGARALDAALESAPAGRRLHILESQLHMTSNRIGLGNLDETYLCRLLHRAFDALRDEDPGWWADFETALRDRHAGADFSALTHSGLEAVACLRARSP